MTQRGRGLVSSQRGFSPYLLDHVVDDAAVLVLRAEHDDLRVGIHLHIVPRRPVEKIVRLTVSRAPFRSVVVIWPLKTNPQWGH